jgi:hypothetical protein
MKGFMPTAGLGVRKLIASRFETLLVDEYLTSKIYSKTGERLTNVQVKRGDQMVSLHEVLTLQGDPSGLYVNRDRNASQNILKILQQHLMDQTRPIEFRRQLSIQPLVNTNGQKKKIVLKIPGEAIPIPRYRIQLKVGSQTEVCEESQHL